MSDLTCLKQINNYTSQQVSNKKNDAWRDASATEIKSAMDSGTFIDNFNFSILMSDLTCLKNI
jgi:beta-N-acetylglucosaminidase